MNSCVLVGNGPSVLDREMGSLIDSYETVVRFNFFHTKGYEKYVGTKTDIWFTTIVVPERMTGYEYKMVYEHSWAWNPSEDETFRALANYYSGRIKKTTLQTVQEMQNFSGNKNYFFYSTGAIAAFLFSTGGRQVSLYGFDWWENRNKHHLGDDILIGPNHRPSDELNFLIKLFKEGRVRDLNPNSKIR